MSSSLARNPTTMIHPRHEAFEHNFLPILCLIFSNPTQTLIMLKHKLLELSSNQRVNLWKSSSNYRSPLSMPGLSSIPLPWFCSLTLNLLSSWSLGKLIPSVSTSMIWFGSSTFNPTRGFSYASTRTPQPSLMSSLPPPPLMAIYSLSHRFMWILHFPSILAFFMMEFDALLCAIKHWGVVLD